MKVIDGSSGLMECRVCENRHYGNLQSGYLRADGITRLYRGSYLTSSVTSSSTIPVFRNGGPAFAWHLMWSSVHG
jgi:hypothetical protein